MYRRDLVMEDSGSPSVDAEQCWGKSGGSRWTNALPPTTCHTAGQPGAQLVIQRHKYTSLDDVTQRMTELIRWGRIIGSECNVCPAQVQLESYWSLKKSNFSGLQRFAFYSKAPGLVLCSSREVSKWWAL